MAAIILAVAKNVLCNLRDRNQQVVEQLQIKYYEINQENVLEAHDPPSLFTASDEFFDYPDAGESAHRPEGMTAHSDCDWLDTLSLLRHKLSRNIQHLSQSHSLIHLLEWSRWVNHSRSGGVTNRIKALAPCYLIGIICFEGRSTFENNIRNTHVYFSVSLFYISFVGDPRQKLRSRGCNAHLSRLCCPSRDNCHISSLR